MAKTEVRTPQVSAELQTESLLRQLVINPDGAVILNGAQTLTTSAVVGCEMFAAWAASAVSAGSIGRSTTVQGPPSNYSPAVLGVTSATSNTINIGYRAETADASAYNNLTASSSVWVYQDTGSAVNCTFSAYRNDGVADAFTSLVSLATTTVSVASGVWTFIKLEGFSVGTTSNGNVNGIELRVSFAVPAITTKSFYADCWQFNRGAKVMPFTRQNFVSEYLKSMRYFERPHHSMATFPDDSINGIFRVTNSNTASTITTACNVPMKVAKRALVSSGVRYDINDGTKATAAFALVNNGAGGFIQVGIPAGQYVDISD